MGTLTKATDTQGITIGIAVVAEHIDGYRGILIGRRGVVLGARRGVFVHAIDDHSDGGGRAVHAGDCKDLGKRIALVQVLNRRIAIVQVIYPVAVGIDGEGAVRTRRISLRGEVLVLRAIDVADGQVARCDQYRVFSNLPLPRCNDGRILHRGNDDIDNSYRRAAMAVVNQDIEAVVTVVVGVGCVGIGAIRIHAHRAVCGVGCLGVDERIVFGIGSRDLARNRGVFGDGMQVMPGSRVQIGINLGRVGAVRDRSDHRGVVAAGHGQGQRRGRRGAGRVLDRVSKLFDDGLPIAQRLGMVIGGIGVAAIGIQNQIAPGAGNHRADRNR